MIYSFTNQKDAVRFINSQGGPIDISLEHVRRGQWEVTVTEKA